MGGEIPKSKGVSAIMSKEVTPSEAKQQHSTRVVKDYKVYIEKLHLKCLANLDDRGFTTGGEIPAMILTVRKSSMAYNAGLRNGDHILKIEDKNVHTFHNLEVERELKLAKEEREGAVVMTVAHLHPWPRNLTEKRYAIMKIKEAWEKLEEKSWGLVKMKREDSDTQLIPNNIKKTSVSDSPTPNRLAIIKHIDGYADVEFTPDGFWDEPPPSDEEEEDLEEQERIMQEWIDFFKTDQPNLQKPQIEPKTLEEQLKEAALN